MRRSYIKGSMVVSGENTPIVATELKLIDLMGAVMVRWGISRNNYKVEPGLYAVGLPGPASDVFVTANYKLSFDHVRKNLAGLNAWILVLETKGVNVWCAAGKGLFGTAELVNRIRKVSLEKYVNHRRLIVPQLGATGVAAFRVKEETGFNVLFGPVRAVDIKTFIRNGYRADKDMRKVRFGLNDRIRLIPNDFIYGKYYLLAAMIVMFLISGLGKTGISYKDFSGEGGPAILKVFLAYLAGIVVTPLFLPWLPGRYFSLKGLISGLIVFLCWLLFETSGQTLPILASWLFITGAISSFMAMNFTGSSTYTSLSGVRKEMKLFVPVQIGFMSAGIILQVIGKMI